MKLFYTLSQKVRKSYLLKMLTVLFCIGLVHEGFSQFSINVSNIRNNSLRVSWSAHPEATHYRVWVRLPIGYWIDDYVYSTIPGSIKQFTSDVFFHDVTDAQYLHPQSLNPLRMAVVGAYNGDKELDVVGVRIELLPPAPIFVSIANITFTGFSVNWKHTEGSQWDHRVIISKKVGAIWQTLDGYPKLLPYPAVTYSVNNLEKGVEYKVNMQRYTRLGTYMNKFMWSDYTEDFVITKPGTPVANAALNVTYNGFLANWNAVKGASSYKIYVYDVVWKSWHLKDHEVPSNSYFVSGLSQNQAYTYYVVAVNSSGESVGSNIVTVTTKQLPVPVAISATNITDTGFRARWNAVSGASYYTLSYNDGITYKLENTTNTFFDVTGLKSNNTYVYKIRARFDTEQSDLSNEITVNTKPTAPVATAASTVTTTTFTANWQAVPSATSYKLWVFSSENTGFNPTGYFPKNVGNVLTSSLTGLEAGHSYSYFLQVTTSKGESFVSNTINVDTKPLAPIALAATNLASSAFMANWQALEGATGYKLYVRKKSDKTIVANYNGKSVQSTLALVAGLTSNTEYEYWVIALKNVTESASSAIITAKTTVQASVQYSLTVNSSPNESGSATGGGTYNQGAVVTVNATPADGYEFVNWTEGTTIISTAESLSLTINTNRTLTANFKAITTNCTLIITTSPSNGGKASGSGTYLQGSSVTVVATPNKGYEFVSWNVGKTVLSTSESYTFTLRSNRSITAIFREATLQLELSYTPKGSGTVNGEGSFKPGSSVTASAIPAEGYEFVHWMEEKTIVSTSSHYTFSLVDDRNLVALFRKETPICSLSVSALPVMGGVCSGGGPYPEGTLVTAVASPVAGYDFVNWVEDGIEVSSSSNYAFYIGTNRTIQANFTPQITNCVVSLASEPNIAGSVSGGGNYNKGSLVTIKAHPTAGYDFLYWTDQITIYSMQPEYTFTLEEDSRLTAVFTPTIKTYSVSALALPEIGGTVSGGGIYPAETAVTLQATAAEGYKFDNWTNGTSIISTIETLVYTVTDDCSLKANFSLKTGLDEKPNKKITIAPNPAITRLNVLGINPSDVITISEITGKTLRIIHASENSCSIDIQNYRAGIYLLKVNTDKGCWIQKWIKE